MNGNLIFLYDPKAAIEQFYQGILCHAKLQIPIISGHWIIRNQIGNGQTHRSGWNSPYPISGFQTKMKDYIGIRQKATDRIRSSRLAKISYPSDKVRCTRFDLGQPEMESFIDHHFDFDQWIYFAVLVALAVCYIACARQWAHLLALSRVVF